MTQHLDIQRFHGSDDITEKDPPHEDVWFIRIHLGNGNFLDISMDNYAERAIKVSAMYGGLHIQPQVSNVISVGVEP